MNPEQAEQLGRLAFDQVPCHLAVVDRQRRLVLSNPAFDEQFSAAQGRHCFEIYKGLDVPCEVCPVLDVLQQGVGQSAVEQGLSRQGKSITYSVKAIPVGGSGQEVELVLLMTQNITRLSELEQELEQSERLASVGLSVAGLAHSIKNILAGLEGGTYLMNSGLDKENTERMLGGWAMVQKYIDQVQALVQNLLSYARPGASRRDQTDPAALVDEVLELFAGKAEMVDVGLERHLEPGIEPLSLDARAIVACLANLVTNALDACVWDPDDTKQHCIQLWARPRPGGGVTYEVADNGMGIPEENQPRILKASFTTKGIRGTGLGLLLTQKTIKEHGGQISFCSTPGQGTTFHIELPDVESRVESKPDKPAVQGETDEQEDTGH